MVLLAATAYVIAGLLFTVFGSMRFKRRNPLAPSSGSEFKGIQYGLVGGMMPWAKESARNHLPTYFTGILYHIGILGSVAALIAASISIDLPLTLRNLLIAMASVGTIAGAGLLVKRLSTHSLRTISTPDDFISNGLVTLYLLTATFTLIHWMSPIIFAATAILLLIYIPLGKIRHCFLFFCSRITFGKFFGRRAVFPRRVVQTERPHVE